MYTQIELQRYYKEIVAILRSNSLALYSNYCLRGAADLPHTLDALALFFADPPEGRPQYAMMVTTQEAAARRDEFRQILLSARVPEHGITKQRELVEAWNDNSAWTDALVEIYNTYCAPMRLPLAFVLFGTTQATGQPVEFIFHPGNVPTIACLEVFQSAVRNAIDRG